MKKFGLILALVTFASIAFASPAFEVDRGTNHPIEHWSYASANQRNTDTGFFAQDVGKIAYQTNTGDYWRLTSLVGGVPTWVYVANGFTQNSIVPNTIPLSGQILVGNAPGTAYAPVTMGGAATIDSTGLLTLAAGAVNNSTFSFTLSSRVLGRLTAGSGLGEELTLSQVLDFIGSAAQGDIIYRGASTWTNLAAGTSGQFLKTQGASANPIWATPAGSGTVTATGGSLTSNAIVLGAGTTDTKVVAGITTDGTAKLTLGVAGTSVGSIDLANATSGTITLSPPTGALGTVTNTVQAVTDTFVYRATTDTLTNKSIAATQLTGGLPIATMAAKAPDANALLPVVLYAKSVTALTTGVPADVATITIPAGITRWRLYGTTSASSTSLLIQETLGGGTNIAASFSGFDAVAGGGNAVFAAVLGLASATSPNNSNPILSSSNATLHTTSSLVIRQTVASANPGTLSFYILIAPLN